MPLDDADNTIFDNLPKPPPDVPSDLLSAYSAGQAFKGLQDAGHSLNDIVLGGMLPPEVSSAYEAAIYGGETPNAFFEQGRLGLPMPERASGMRFGRAGERSWNFADDRAEPGVSMAYVDHPSVRDYRWYNMGGSSGKPAFYSGWLLHGRSGSEGEPLMVGLKPTKPFPLPTDIPGMGHIALPQATTRPPVGLMGQEERLFRQREDDQPQD